MALRLYNSLTRKKEDFVPLDPANVRLYVCGPTVYDHAHIGNARPVIVFDVLYRLLRHIYGETHVTYARNITDVDDKIIDRARRDFPDVDLNAAIKKVTTSTTAQFHADVKALGCLEPTIEPKATDHIEEMKAIIATLVAKGFAYEASGHVLFRVDRMAEYGQLSGRSTNEMIAGARVEVAPYKENPMDFVLWKPSDADQPGWDSDWGHGRPGWHLECSAMAEKHLGKVFDIHGGGVDLKFPHHENEIAQSRCAHGTGAMANVWMHNGFLQVEGEKMSKSAGNFVTIRELLRGWHGEPWSGAAIRLEMFGTHYRQPIDWTLARLKTAKAHVQMIARITSSQGFRDDDGYKHAWSGEICPSAELLEALCDDLNTAKIMNDIKRLSSGESKLNTDERIKLTHNVRFLGLMNERNHKWLTGSHGLSNMAENLVNSSSIRFRDYRIAKANNDGEVEISLGGWFSNKDIKVVDERTIRYFGSSPTAGQIERLVDTRNAVRKAKDFAEADRIRDELAAMGVVLKDNPDGTTEWEIAQ